MKIIAFGHRKRVGKDTATRFLSSHLRTTYKNLNIRKMRFASKLKDMTYELYSWAGLKDEEHYEEHPEEKDLILPILGKSPRQIWIEFGTLVGRVVYNDTWTKYLFKQINCDILIISDMRFPNEAEAVLSAGGFVIKINRPDIIPSSDIADDPLKDYDNWTTIIENTGDLAAFNQKIITLAKELKL